MIQLFDIKKRNLGFAFCQPPKKSLPKSLTQKKSLQNFKPKKSPQIANLKPNKGLHTSPSLIYLRTPPGLKTLFTPGKKVITLRGQLIVLKGWLYCMILCACEHKQISWGSMLFVRLQLYSICTVTNHQITKDCIS